jgi:hypothetical protein
MSTATGPVTSEDRHRDDALAADVADVLAGFPPLTREQCDRVAILLWPRHTCAIAGTPPPRAA